MAKLNRSHGEPGDLLLAVGVSSGRQSCGAEPLICGVGVNSDEYQD